MSKLNIVYHRKDLDGLCCGFLARNYFSFKDQEKLVMIPWDYNDSIPVFSDDDDIIMLDVSFPKKEMEKIKDNLIWIDHHKSAIEDNDPEIKGIRRIGDSASLLACEYFYPTAKVPDLVYWIDRFDVWKQGDDWNDVLIRQYAMRINLKDPAIATEMAKWIKQINLFTLNNPESYKTILNINEVAVKRWFVCKFEGYSFLALNHEGNSNAFDSIYHPSFDGTMLFKYDGQKGKWSVSLYGNYKGIDLSVIAVKYGGGGHANACGFTVDNINDIIK